MSHGRTVTCEDGEDSCCEVQAVEKRVISTQLTFDLDDNLMGIILVFDDETLLQGVSDALGFEFVTQNDLFDA